MSVLRSIEQKIEGLFEGMFGRAFRAHVQPVELARKLAKEMDEHRTISVSRVYVPNEYSVYLSEADREQFESYEGSLIGELQDYLVEHARRESYAMLTPPKVLMLTDADLSLGAFGIATRMVQPDGRRAPVPDEPAAQVEPGATMIYKPKAQPPTEAASAEELGVEREEFSLTIERQAACARRAARRARPLEGVRRPGVRCERLAPPCRAAAGGVGLVARRSRLDERHGAERQAGTPRQALGRRHDHGRRDEPRLRPAGIVSNVDVDTALLVLKVAFIVLLYLFIWRIVAGASRDFRTTAPAQESQIIAPGQAAAGSAAPRPQPGARLVVVKSAALRKGEEIPVAAAPVAIGRGGQNDVPLDGDEFASAEHARFETRRDGLWVEDVGSTNGTFVNGARVTTPRRLGKGDIVRVGQTDFRVEG